MEQSPHINASRFRKKKEVVYFILVALVSVVVWAGSLWGFYNGVQQMTNQPSFDAAKQCYGLVEDGGQAYIVPEQYKSLFLENGEQCIDYDKLSPEQREAALKEYRESERSTQQEEAGVYFAFFGILLAILLFGFLMHLYALAFIRATAIRAGANQFPELWESAQQISARLGMKKAPDIFILNGEGMLNAFATKLIRRKIVILFSDLAETLMEPGNRAQLDAVLAHEIGHHALGHTKLYLWLLFPGEFIPFISFSWSREREYSADRVMQALIADSESYERGLTKLAAGKLFGQTANIDAYVEQIKQERGFMVKWAEYFSTHPFLPKRIRELRRYKEFLERTAK